MIEPSWRWWPAEQPDELQRRMTRLVGDLRQLRDPDRLFHVERQGVFAIPARCEREGGAADEGLDSWLSEPNRALQYGAGELRLPAGIT